MDTLLSVNEVAELAGVRPRDISDAFYQGVLDVGKITMIGNRRAIPASMVPEIRRILRDKARR